MPKKITTTVLVCALNEEKNIANLLGDLISQKSKRINIKKTVVISDGSTDNTNKIVQSFAPKVDLIKFKTRAGKAKRLNDFFKQNNSDVIVVVDADLRLSGPKLIESMVLPFSKDKNIGMVGGNHQPYMVNTFVQHAIKSSFDTYSRLRQKHPSLSFGPIVAYSNKLAKRINFPRNISGEDAYSYLSCLSLGYKYKYSKTSLVYFILPKNLSDHLKQNLRFLNVSSNMEHYFPHSLVQKESTISKTDLYKSALLSLLKYPIPTVAIILINQYCRLLANLNEGKISGKWEIASSTK